MIFVTLWFKTLFKNIFWRLGLSGSSSMRRDYYRGSQDSLAIRGIFFFSLFFRCKNSKINLNNEFLRPHALLWFFVILDTFMFFFSCNGRTKWLIENKFLYVTVFLFFSLLCHFAHWWLVQQNPPMNTQARIPRRWVDGVATRWSVLEVTS